MSGKKSSQYEKITNEMISGINKKILLFRYSVMNVLICFWYFPNKTPTGKAIVYKVHHILHQPLIGDTSTNIAIQKQITNKPINLTVSEKGNLDINQ